MNSQPPPGLVLAVGMWSTADLFQGWYTMDLGDQHPVQLAVGRTRWLLLALGILLLVVLRNQPWDCLVGYDQAKQAYVSLEMVQDGHWLHQHLPTGYPATKPPLVGWISAGLHPVLGGWWEGAWRAPSFLAFLAIVLILWKTARDVGQEWGAFLAIAVFSLNMLTIRLATLIRTDMFLALSILCGGVLIWRQIRENRPWTPARRGLFALIVLAACFTKGPVIVVYLLIPLLVWRFMCWRRGELPFAWAGWWPWLVPLGLFALWVTIGCLRDEQFFRMVVLKEFGTNFAAISVTDNGHVTVGSRHFGMMLTYPLQLLHRLFPWSIAMVLWVMLERQGRKRLVSDAGSRWLLVWIGVSLLLMSLVPNKRVDRIFPIVAPLALLAAHMLAAGTWERARRLDPRRVVSVLALIGFLAWGGYTAYWHWDGNNEEKNQELARRELCRAAVAVAREARLDLKILGPVSDLNQTLLTYLRCTAPVGADTLKRELEQGHAIMMPLAGTMQSNLLWRVIIRTECVMEGHCGYGVVVGAGR